jgi:nicotinamide-nucleotide amidase
LSDGASNGGAAVAAGCLDALRAREETVSTAESLTAGLVCSTIAAVPGASDCLRGALVAYATQVKSSVLGVDPQLIRDHGVVSAECAAAMADAARQLFASDWSIATTGVAGPTDQDGQPVGTVFVAVSGADGVQVRALALTGDRAAIRRQSADGALDLLAGLLGLSRPISG